MYSLVIPVYRNEDSIPELLDVLDTLNRSLSGTLEVVFVVDASPDRCFELLTLALPKRSFKSQLLLHSRNFGSFAAIRTGLAAATGEYFAAMAADLQEPPELALDFFRELQADQADVVVGTRESRGDPLGTRLTSSVYWWIYRKLVIAEIPPGGVDLFGCNRDFRDTLLTLEEAHSSLVGLIYWLGFRRKTIAYKRLARRHGKSAWTLRRKLNYFLDSVFAFTDLPVKLLIAVGIIGLAFSLVFVAVIIAVKIFDSFEVPGYAATVVTILFFGALNALGLGIIGSYVWRAYANTQRRPLSIVTRKNSFAAIESNNSSSIAEVSSERLRS